MRDMKPHVWMLGILHIVFGALGLIAAVVVLVVFGGATSIVSLTAPDPDAAVAVPVIGLVGAFIVGLIAVLSLPGLAVGIGLVKYQAWARIGGIVISALELFSPPVGTVLGIYGLWVLLSRESEPVFA